MRILLMATLLLIASGLALADDIATAKPNPPVLQETTSQFPKGEQVQYRVLTATILPGTHSPWHTHPAPVAVYVETGVFTLECKGGESRSVKAGEALLEPTSLEVRAANLGSAPTTVVIFQVSEPAEPFLKPSK